MAVQAGQVLSDAPKLAMLLAVEAVSEGRQSKRPIVEPGQALRDVLASWSGTDSQTLMGHAGPVLSLSYDPNGKTLASASADGTIRLWNTRDGQLRLVLEGQSSAISHISYKPDGSILASVNDDNTLRGWDPTTGRPLPPPGRSIPIGLLVSNFPPMERPWQ